MIGTCFYCERTASDRCPRCGAQICDEHSTEDGECSSLEVPLIPMHSPDGDGPLEDWINETTVDDVKEI